MLQPLMLHFLLLVILLGNKMFLLYLFAHHYIGFFFLFFSATTHSDLILRARIKGIKVEVIHNASIMSAVACCGLQVGFFAFLPF